MTEPKPKASEAPPAGANATVESRIAFLESELIAVQRTLVKAFPDCGLTCPPQAEAPRKPAKSGEPKK